jgi:hypothetical protein
MIATIDPARAWVLSVGIERYSYGAGMDLPGAASEATRFARWALGCGIPADRVLLACAWLDASTVPLDGMRLIDTTRDALEDAIVSTAACEGELLMIFWCGHGVLNNRGERALFTSDASVANKRNIVVEELLAYLSSNRLSGLGQQILLVDACANFVEDMRLNEALPHATLPKGDPREVAQFAYFAAAQGQIANFNRTKRHATFSTTALTWLEQHAAMTLPPDVIELACHVDGVFEGLREAGQLRQTPVYRQIRHYRGHEDILRLAGGIPVAGGVQATVRASGTTVSQIRRVASAIAEVPMLVTPVGRLRLVTALEGVANRAVVDESELVDVVVPRLAAGQAKQIFDALRGQAKTESDILAVRQVEDCWRRQKWIAPALRSFSTVTRRQVRTAYFRAVPSSDVSAPQDLDEAMDMAAAYGRRPAGVTPLHRLVAILEHLTREKVGDDWYGLSPDRLNALRQGAAAAQTEAARLVIDLRNPDAATAAFSWPGTVVGHLHLAGKGWSRTRVSFEPTMAGAHDAVAHLVEWTHLQGIATFTIGLIVPRAGLDSMPEAWAYGDMLEEPTPLWHERPTVLHSAERLSTSKARAWWREKTAAIKKRLANEPPEVLWIEPVDRDSPASIRAAVRGAEASCFGLAFAPGDCCHDLRRDPIVAAIAGGAPYVVWAGHEPPDWKTTKQQLLALASDGTFEELPIRLHRMRAAEAEGPGSVLRLIWDEPETLPPLGQLIGISGGNDSDG